MLLNVPLNPGQWRAMRQLSFKLKFKLFSFIILTTEPSIHMIIGAGWHKHTELKHLRRPTNWMRALIIVLSRPHVEASIFLETNRKIEIIHFRFQFQNNSLYHFNTLNHSNRIISSHCHFMSPKWPIINCHFPWINNFLHNTNKMNQTKKSKSFCPFSESSMKVIVVRFGIERIKKLQWWMHQNKYGFKVDGLPHQSWSEAQSNWWERWQSMIIAQIGDECK